MQLSHDVVREFYYSGATPFFASKLDQRFSYALYVPTPRDEDPDKFPLIVIQHGTGRSAELYRDLMADFCEKYRVVVLVPLFPGGIGEQHDLHNFKFIAYAGIRYDRILLGMVDEISEFLPVAVDKFYLHGFSGGGQFTHRFMYLHPNRLLGVSVGAPGRLTFLDKSRDWWLGTRNFREIFDQDIDIDALRALPIQLIVGDRDVDAWEINNPSNELWVPGLELQGQTRVERLKNYQRNLAAHGIQARLDIVPGIAHEGDKILPHAATYFGDLIGLKSNQPQRVGHGSKG